MDISEKTIVEHLFDKLAQYAEGDIYPYHMPGHKRQAWGALPGQLYEMDITEIDGFDNLHQPEGILLELQRKAARIYGADESFYLINGSTCGILCAVSSALPAGGHILMARNCHRSAYHGAYLRNLAVSYLWPPYLEKYDVYDAVTPEQVQAALEREPDIGAVMVVSPTYEGRIADVEAIAEVVHRRGIPLIVDEAHGAHLGLAEGLFRNSCQAGADLVIHSVHKTLPALTQTALLHVNGGMIDRRLLYRSLHIYQSSSPSYLLMASIDNALQYVESGGQEAFGRFRRLYGEMMERLAGCRNLRILRDARTGYEDVREDMRKGREENTGEDLRKERERNTREDIRKERERNVGEDADAGQGEASGQEGGSVWKAQGRQDIGKLLISVKQTSLTGKQLYDILLKKYHLQTEMAAESYVLAMFTVNDGEEAYRRMTEALLEIDKDLATWAAEDLSREPSAAFGRNSEGRDESGKTVNYGARHGYVSCRDMIPLALAWDLPAEEVPLEESVGRHMGEFISLYPPGIPLVVPGERMTEELLKGIQKAWEQGLAVQGIHMREKGHPFENKGRLYTDVICEEEGICNETG